jgi:hypothetical protein
MASQRSRTELDHLNARRSDRYPVDGLILPRFDPALITVQGHASPSFGFSNIDPVLRVAGGHNGSLGSLSAFSASLTWRIIAPMALLQLPFARIQSNS